MSIQGAYIYCSRRNVQVVRFQLCDGRLYRPDICSGELTVTLQMNIYGEITYPRGGAFYKNTGVVEDGYLRFELERELGSSKMTYVTLVPEQDFVALDTRRKAMLDKGE